MDGAAAGPPASCSSSTAGAWRAAGPPTMVLMDTRARAFAGWGWAAAVVDYRAFADAPGDVVRAYDAAQARFPGLPICAYGGPRRAASWRSCSRAPPAGVRGRRRRTRRPAAAGRHAAGRLGARQGAGRLGDLRDASPTHHAAAIRAPVLAGYGAADRIVPASQGAPQARADPRPRDRARGRPRAALRARHRAAAALRGWWTPCVPSFSAPRGRARSRRRPSGARPAAGPRAARASRPRPRARGTRRGRSRRPAPGARRCADAARARCGR